MNAGGADDRGCRASCKSVFAALCLTFAASLPAAAQTPALYEEAQAELAANDRASALVKLRRLTEAEPDFAPGWGLLGRTLTEIASGVATDFKQRKEAEEALRRALELDPHNPAHLAAFGQLNSRTTPCHSSTNNQYVVRHGQNIFFKI